ncbi:MAG: L-rhamnose mutarotase [Niabella sp.]
MKRVGSIIYLEADKINEYKQLHARVWPEILANIHACNIKNYSIFLKEPENILFSYFTYHGDDFKADMQKMAQTPIVQKWWKLCSPCQKPLETRRKGEWWAEMEEVFFYA